MITTLLALHTSFRVLGGTNCLPSIHPSSLGVTKGASKQGAVGCCPRVPATKRDGPLQWDLQLDMHATLLCSSRQPPPVLMPRHTRGNMHARKRKATRIQASPADTSSHPPTAPVAHHKWNFAKGGEDPLARSRFGLEGCTSRTLYGRPTSKT
ncbi:hypothetical protein B0J13DRAFT_227955 [Dactylonectria estremocensis]|uniref:Uncharacterized protein n=1 Tax=Dactylonectria estremocensis TaxID=1079267 RepID=A0A9P9J7Q9_9HYPO|nr:hypothetical protein B0J13DRAFT_227955 [Dactylonectria estremocensis]